jgi:4-hydroxybenzoate polyprenyltransferase
MRTPAWFRWLQCVRMDEVAVLQGTPLMGFVFALDRGVQRSGTDTLCTLVALVCASACLVAHIIVLNDWAGIDDDLKDPNRSAKTFLSLGISRRAMWCMAQLWAVLGLAFSAYLGLHPLWVAGGMLVASTLYSSPRWHLKGIPIASSLLHLAGGILHFLLGYLAIAEMNLQSLVFACYFGVVFAAGHLMHEVRGHDADAANGILTNAVAFGKNAACIAAFVLFSAAYALVAIWAALERHSLLLSLSLAAYLLHGVKTWRVFQSRLEPHPLLQLQRYYRFNFALIGLVLLGTFALPFVHGRVSGLAG